MPAIVEHLRRSLHGALPLLALGLLGACSGSISFQFGDPIEPPAERLSDLDGITTFSGAAASTSASPALAAPESFLDSASADTRITIDPRAGTFRLVILQGGGAVSQDITFTPADRVDAAGGTSDLYRRAGASDRALFILNPGSRGSGFDFASYGIWDTREVDGSTGGTIFQGGALAYGFVTPAGEVPRSGTATYRGLMNGHLVTGGGADPLFLSGSATLRADFIAGSLNSSFTGITASSTFGATGAMTFRDIDGQATISGASFAGPLSTAGSPPADLGADMSGRLVGNFYGPAAVEAGGVFRMTGSDGSVATGGFAAGR